MSATEFLDAHGHIIDPHFPLWENQGYPPPAFMLTLRVSGARISMSQKALAFYRPV